jgi:hypothetical protein
MTVALLELLVMCIYPTLSQSPSSEAECSALSRFEAFKAGHIVTCPAGSVDSGRPLVWTW